MSRDGKLKEKDCCFESDDWGTIRMPSKEVQQKLVSWHKRDKNYYK